MKKQLSLKGLILCLSRISLRGYCPKNVVKIGALEKDVKENGHIGGEWGSNLLHLISENVLQS